MSFRPLGDRVLVVINKAEEMSAGGVIIPTTAQEKPQTGKVVAVGPGRHTEGGNFVPTSLSNGDIVMIAKYAGTEIKLDNVDHLVISESDIIGVVNEA